MKSNTDLTEQQRLEALYAYDVLDTEAEQDFDLLVELASEIAGTPISAISLIDIDRQWFKAVKGLCVNQTARELAFCNHAIQSNDSAFIITDAAKDQRFYNNALVTSDPHIRFYAGFPLVTPGGNKLGTLCVIDCEPRQLAEKQIKKLTIVARQAMKLLELRLAYKNLNKLRQEAENQNQTLERLLNHQRKIIAILAHDTRGPLYSMNQLLDMLANGLISEEETGKVYEMMMEQANTTISMIEGLVKWGELHLNTPAFKGFIQNPNAVVEKVFAQYAAGASAKAIQLVASMEPAAGICMQPETLGFIVRNLVSNAVKYTEQGTITVSGRQDGDAYLVSVTDTGLGMSEQVKQSLFKGKAASVTGTRNERGTGLGLMLVNDFVQQLGGSIEVQSKLAAGTSITVRLPSVIKPH